MERSKFTSKEEFANALSHFIGILLSVAALILMITRSLHAGNNLYLITGIVFGVSMILLYVSSTLTHHLEQGGEKNLFFTFDKIAIYLLIAGTYTPFALITIQGALGWTIFGIEWGGALLGTYLILRRPVKFEKGVNIFSILSYAVMGWLIIVATIPIIKALPIMGWLLIFIGGALYTIGIFFYKKGKFRYHHLVWHLFVLAGNAAHFFAIYFYVMRG